MKIWIGPGRVFPGLCCVEPSPELLRFQCEALWGEAGAALQRWGAVAAAVCKADVLLGPLHVESSRVVPCLGLSREVSAAFRR